MSTRVADVSTRRRLGSASTDQLTVPAYCLSTVEMRAFPIAGARIWNDLPPDVTSAPSLTVFKQLLKTMLFNRSYQHTTLYQHTCLSELFFLMKTP